MNSLAIANFGNLPFGLSPVLLRQPHASIPANSLLAEPLYLAGFIERLGTGIPDMIDLCRNVGLKEPEFSQEDTFKTILWRIDSFDGDAPDKLPDKQPDKLMKKLPDKLPIKLPHKQPIKQPYKLPHKLMKKLLNPYEELYWF